MTSMRIVVAIMVMLSGCYDSVRLVHRGGVVVEENGECADVRTDPLAPDADRSCVDERKLNRRKTAGVLVVAAGLAVVAVVFAAVARSNGGNPRSGL